MYKTTKCGLLCQLTRYIRRTKWQGYKRYNMTLCSHSAVTKHFSTGGY